MRGMCNVVALLHAAVGHIHPADPGLALTLISTN